METKYEVINLDTKEISKVTMMTFGNMDKRKLYDFQMKGIKGIS